MSLKKIMFMLAMSSFVFVGSVAAHAQAQPHFVIVNLTSGKSFNMHYEPNSKPQVTVDGTPAEKASIQVETDPVSGSIMIQQMRSSQTSSAPSTLAINVTVPWKSSGQVGITGHYDSVDLGDFDSLDVEENGDTSVHFGHVNKETHLILMGHGASITGDSVSEGPTNCSILSDGTITLNSVNGKLSTLIQKVGHIVVKDGDIKEIDLSGNGSTEVNGKIHGGSIGSNKAGVFNVKTVVDGAKIKSMGSGQITIQ